MRVPCDRRVRIGAIFLLVTVLTIYVFLGRHLVILTKDDISHKRLDGWKKHVLYHWEKNTVTGPESTFVLENHDIIVGHTLTRKSEMNQVMTDVDNEHPQILHTDLRTETLQNNHLIKLKNDDPEFSFRKNDLFVPSKCPTSIQKKLSNMSWTSELYHPEIKQLLTSTDISVEEYNRLLHYWMPFGFKYHQNFTYKELLKVLKLFPNDDSIVDYSGYKSRPQCLSCAVVGNGGILNGSRMGSEIDSHDMVFRVNHCIRRGFEADVGNRTTHLVLMDRSLIHTQTKDIPRDKGIKYILLTCRKQDYQYITNVVTSSNPRQKFRASATDVRILHPDFTRYVHKIWENTNSFRPTTGGMMFFIALHAGCDSLGVYGMGFTAKYTEHYYDKDYIKYKNFGGSHDFKKEIKILKQLDLDGVIRWYKRDVQEFY